TTRSSSAALGVNTRCVKIDPRAESSWVGSLRSNRDEAIHDPATTMPRRFGMIGPLVTKLPLAYVFKREMVGAFLRNGSETNAGGAPKPSTRRVHSGVGRRGVSETAKPAAF